MRSPRTARRTCRAARRRAARRDEASPGPPAGRGRPSRPGPPPARGRSRPRCSRWDRARARPGAPRASTYVTAACSGTLGPRPWSAIRLSERAEHAVGHRPQVGPVLLEPLRQPVALVHRSHSSLEICHSNDRRNRADVTREVRPMLQRVARWCYHRRWLTLVIWIIALVGAQFAASSAGGDYASDFSLPGADSQKAFDLLNDRYPQASGDTAQIVYKADDGAMSPDVRSAMQGLFTEIERLPHVQEVVSPYLPDTSTQISKDRAIAFADIRFDVRASKVPKDVVDRIEDL